MDQSKGPKVTAAFESLHRIRTKPKKREAQGFANTISVFARWPDAKIEIDPSPGETSVSSGAALVVERLAECCIIADFEPCESGVVDLVGDSIARSRFH